MPQRGRQRSKLLGVAGEVANIEVEVQDFMPRCWDEPLKEVTGSRKDEGFQ